MCVCVSVCVSVCASVSVCVSVCPSVYFCVTRFVKGVLHTSSFRAYYNTVYSKPTVLKLWGKTIPLLH